LTVLSQLIQQHQIKNVYDELKDSTPSIENKNAVDLFIKYFENTWIKENCHFDRSIWNLYDQYSSRTNNISETYNHKVNGQVMSANSNIYKIIDLLRKQEALTATQYERANLGKEKKIATQQKLKDAQIHILKKEYEHGEIDVMDYLIKISEFIADYD
jgi:hypothetical protein